MNLCFLWLFEAIIITSWMDLAFITVFLVVFAERKKAPNLIYEWGFKGPHCKFKFKKETGSSGIPCSLHLGNTDLYLWLLPLWFLLWKITVNLSYYLRPLWWLVSKKLPSSCKHILLENLLEKRLIDCAECSLCSELEKYTYIIICNCRTCFQF